LVALRLSEQPGLREAAEAIYEADRHAKKELKKQLRGIRPIERQLEARRTPRRRPSAGTVRRPECIYRYHAAPTLRQRPQTRRTGHRRLQLSLSGRRRHRPPAPLRSRRSLAARSRAGASSGGNSPTARRPVGPCAAFAATRLPICMRSKNTSSSSLCRPGKSRGLASGISSWALWDFAARHGEFGRLIRSRRRDLVAAGSAAALLLVHGAEDLVGQRRSWSLPG
jgi:hypothetical protein